MLRIDCGWSGSCDGARLYDGRSVYGSGAGPDGFDALKISVVPRGQTASTADITAMLIYYAQLNDGVNQVISKANQAGRTVWSAFDDIGEASSYLTTLTIPDGYENVTLTDQQQRMLLAISMNDLAGYWTKNGHRVKTDGYELTMDSMTLYCHGDITRRAVNPDGSIDVRIYEDVIYTPIYQRSASLQLGQNTLSDYCYVLIYGKGPLTSGTRAVDFESCEGVWLGADSRIGVDKMFYGGKQTDRVDLVCSEVEYIDSEKMKRLVDPVPPPEPEPEDNLEDIIRLILVLIGAGLLLCGAGRRDLLIIGAGVLLILAGVFLADDLAGLIRGLQKAADWWPF